jgi:hypothetical protein
MKGKTEAKRDAELDRTAKSRLAPLGKQDPLSVPESPATQRAKRSAAAASLISFAAGVHDVSGAAKAL